MEKYIEIAGVSVAKSYVKKIDYDTIFEQARYTKKYYGNPKAEELIKAELKEHGILKKDKPKSAKDNGVKDNPATGKSNTKKKRTTSQDS